MDNYSSTYDRLLHDGYTPQQGLMERKNLTIKEKGQVYRAKIDDKRKSALFDIDGNIITEGEKCDKLVLVENSVPNTWSEVFVELKGKDVHHAVGQLRSTISNPLFKHSSNTIIKARIVSASCPSNKSDIGIEKAKIEFRNKYKCELKTLKSTQPDRL